MVTINQMAKMIIGISGKRLSIKHVSGPLGVRGRNSDNKLIREKMGLGANHAAIGWTNNNLWLD